MTAIGVAVLVVVWVVMRLYLKSRPPRDKMPGAPAATPEEGTQGAPPSRTLSVLLTGAVLLALFLAIWRLLPAESGSLRPSALRCGSDRACVHERAMRFVD